MDLILTGNTMKYLEENTEINLHDSKLGKISYTWHPKYQLQKKVQILFHHNYHYDYGAISNYHESIKVIHWMWENSFNYIW
jgi:hypothetical protein